jgi:hypothetical protein
MAETKRDEMGLVALAKMLNEDAALTKWRALMA